MKKLRSQKSSKSKRFLILASILLVAIFSLSYYRANKQSLTPINEITSLTYGPVEMTGNLFKETPAGVPGSYLLVSLAGRVVELEVPTNIDKLVGQPVIVRGDLVPSLIVGGQPILIVSSITVKP